MFSALEIDAAAGYKCPVKIWLLKGALLLGRSGTRLKGFAGRGIRLFVVVDYICNTGVFSILDL